VSLPRPTQPAANAPVKEIPAPVAVPSVKPPIAGFYASARRFTNDPKRPGNPGRFGRELTLTLSPAGGYHAWWREYYDGAPVRFSGLMPYDLQTNSTGSWTISDGQLFFRSTGPSYVVTRWMMEKNGTTITPEQGEASIDYRDGHWVIVWKETEYIRQDDEPNKAPVPAPFEPAGVVAHP